MKTRSTVFLATLLAIVLLGMQPSRTIAQTVNVKFKCNTSTCLDTLRPSHVVMVLGGSAKGTTPAMSWTVASGLPMTNKGGDYWEATLQAKPGDTITYKFWTGFNISTSTFHWTGWEGPIDAGSPSGDNRLLFVGSNDTTLALQYFNGWESKVAQYWRPFASKTDSIAVYFRVNMGGATFNPATQVVDVRGGAPLGADPSWVNIKTLTRETNSVNSGSFWSGVAYVPKASVTPGATQQLFKFVIQPEVWESTGNRSFTFSGTSDTTIQWYYFNDRPPSGPKVDGTVLFALKLDALERAHVFNRAIGDKIAVTGAKGWPPGTFTFDTEPTMLKMTYDPTAKEWDRAEPFSLFPGETVTYKYYIAWDSTRVDSTSPNFIRGLQLSNGWEEPGSTGGADRKYVYGNTVQQVVGGDFGADQQFFNSLHWKGVITKPIQVTFTVDMAPATSAVTNPGTLFRPGVDTAYVQFDGCLVPVTQGKTMWGTDNRLTLTDPDGDGKYTATYNLTAPTFPQFCYRLVYTSPSGEIWNGSGSAIVGRRYYQYAHPTKVFADSAQWPSTYALTQVAWKLDNLTIEDPPDLNTVTGVADGSRDVPGSYELQQNYPNPFNPTTMISYQLPVAADVRVIVFDMLGREVSVLVNERKDAGVHAVSFDGSGLSSGMYFYRMQVRPSDSVLGRDSRGGAGSFVQTRKLMVLK
jgi:hypothetical protein